LFSLTGSGFRFKAAKLRNRLLLDNWKLRRVWRVGGWCAFRTTFQLVFHCRVHAEQTRGKMVQVTWAPIEKHIELGFSLNLLVEFRLLFALIYFCMDAIIK
jgi:hypothetical protein